MSLCIIHWDKKAVYFQWYLHWEKAIRACYKPNKTIYSSSLWGRRNFTHRRNFEIHSLKFIIIRKATNAKVQTLNSIYSHLRKQTSLWVSGSYQEDRKRKLNHFTDPTQLSSICTTAKYMLISHGHVTVSCRQAVWNSFVFTKGDWPILDKDHSATKC